MGKYITPMIAQQISENLWEIKEPLIYKSNKLGFVIADTGTRTNFATVPRLPIFYLVAGGKNNPPAVLHDKLHEKEHTTGAGLKVTRLQADNLYFEAILDWIPVEGYSLKSIAMRVLSYALAAISWLFVRACGWYFWK